MIDRQIEIVHNLRIPPYGYDEMREYRVERIERYGRPGEFLPHLMVERVYSRAGLSLAYHEGFIVGPRGGVKTTYRSFY